MKKIFQLQQENKKSERVIEAVKHEIRKYIKRERAKKLPNGTDYWELTCRFGQNIDESSSLKSQEIIAALDSAYNSQWKECYVEIIANPIIKPIVKISEDVEPTE